VNDISKGGFPQAQNLQRLWTKQQNRPHYLFGGQAQPRRNLQPTGKGSLDFIAAGPIPPNPSELLLDDKFGALIAWLRERYDYIVMDTPPVTLIADAFELMRFSDAYIYVMRQNYTKRQVLTFVDNLHRTNQFPKGSIVLNDFMHELASGYGYGYYEADEQVQRPWWNRILSK
jgi:Mrp family chromosome partitioning ATPase